LVKKFCAFYGMQQFITVSTRAYHWIITRWIQSTPSHPVSFNIHFNIVLQSLLRFLSDLVPSGFLTKILYSFLISPFMLLVLSISPSLILWP
jgi:hypothetical protein